MPPMFSARTFSALARMRTAAMPHVFESTTYSTAQRAARPDWGKQVRHVGDAAAIYFPFMAFFLGWPILAGKALNGRM